MRWRLWSSGAGVKVRLGLVASARLLVSLLLWIQGLNSSACVPWFLCCSNDE